ncbi:hypothetical protein GW17_00059535, partial [Ensete ventricosum]
GSCPCPLPNPCGWHRLPYWWQGWLRATAPFGCPTIDPLCGHRAVSGCARRRLLPLAGAAGLPFGLAPVATNRPLAGGLGRGLAVGGRPCMGAGRAWSPFLLAAFAAKT